MLAFMQESSEMDIPEKEDTPYKDTG